MVYENSLSSVLESGAPALGGVVATHSPALIEVYGNLGLDFVWVDFEHTGPSPASSPALEALTRAADVANTELLLRPPSGDPHLLAKVLDSGVTTVLIPRVETAAEVRDAVRATRFSYDGEPGNRGVGVGRASLWGADLETYVQRADESALLGVMIETREAVANIEDIVSVPGLGFVFVGPADLSVSLGVPMQTDSEIVSRHIEQVRDAAVTADVPIGGIASDVAEGQQLIDDGYQLLRIGDEISILRATLSERITELQL